MKALLAQFIFESNTFNPELAELETFVSNGVWLNGEQRVLPWLQSNAGQMRSSYELLSEMGWDVHPVFIATCGSPAGRLSRSAYERLRDEMCSALSSSFPADGIILHLHGASCAEGSDDVEGALLEWIREELLFKGRIIISLDLHANVTRKMLDHADGVTAYRTMPHTDFEETGERAVRLLVEGQPIRVRMAKIAALIQPTSTRHDAGSFSEILAKAKQVEEHCGTVLDVSLFPVQPWLDVEDMGIAVTVTERIGATTDLDVLSDLAQSWYETRHQWNTVLPSWDEILEQLKLSEKAPWILADAADATTAGAPGTNAEILQRLLPHESEFAGEVLIHIVDPTAYLALSRGATSCELGIQNVRVAGEVQVFGKCSYIPRGKSYHGIKLSMGESAVLSLGKLRIVVTTAGSLCADPAFYEAVGLHPDKAQAVHVKSLMGWLTGYEIPFEQGLIFDTGGMASLDFCSLGFCGERLNLYPINEAPQNPITYYP